MSLERIEKRKKVHTIGRIMAEGGVWRMRCVLRVGDLRCDELVLVYV